MCAGLEDWLLEAAVRRELAQSIREQEHQRVCVLTHANVDTRDWHKSDRQEVKRHVCRQVEGQRRGRVKDTRHTHLTILVVVVKFKLILLFVSSVYLYEDIPDLNNKINI